ncbi:HNH endonuclease [Paenibacillus sp. FSL L8-0435]|uniref:phosphorothioated DNA-binding restriction endonuclease n=1 Tax=Paenibacillus sp. FSL L8-0435 TaxID=2954618 RepID=UPI0030DC13E2
MNREELINKINKITIWKNSGHRSPHKPLLILLALGLLQSSDVENISYIEVKDKLRLLLGEFGPHRSTIHPEYPFVRLKNDGIWDLNKPVDNNATSAQLVRNEVSGGFTSEVILLLKEQPSLISELASILLETHFPNSIHNEVLNEVGLSINKGNKRNPNFRGMVLRAYGYNCAVCGYNLRMGHNLVGLEAAHIKWVQAGGPNVESNGIALCSIHHKLFDRGAYTISKDNDILVSEDVHGSRGLTEWLLKYHRRKMKSPISIEYRPLNGYLNWHHEEVFKGKIRSF